MSLHWHIIKCFAGVQLQQPGIQPEEMDSVDEWDSLSVFYGCQVTSVVSNSVRPHRWQPTRLPGPWDSPGKNPGVGCHFLQCMKVKSESEVAQSCPRLSDLMDCSPPASSIHGIFQARVLEWGAMFSIDCLFISSLRFSFILLQKH